MSLPLGARRRLSVALISLSLLPAACSVNLDVPAGASPPAPTLVDDAGHVDVGAVDGGPAWTDAAGVAPSASAPDGAAEEETPPPIDDPPVDPPPADDPPVDPPPADDPPVDPPPPPPPPFGCGASATAAGFVGRQSLDVAGTTRTYELYLPASYDSTHAYPIVLAFHGDGGTGAGIRNGLPLEAASGGQAIFVYPDGTGKTWHNDTLNTLQPDVAFVDAIVDSLQATYCVDSTRLFATGMSRGAYFVNQMVCRSRTAFRGIATHAGGGPWAVTNSEWDGQGNFICPATLRALQVQGLADAVVPPSEGQKARNFWRAKNGCSATTSAYGTSPCVAYAGCSQPEVWCEIPGLGHQLWSSAAQVTWSFFASTP